jgi:lipoprotein-releasing system permease protein
MYKLVLAWRYLRTRKLALASIVSVMLGVATLIVVNSVMGGFSTKLRERMRGLQAHVTVQCRSHDGFPDYAGKMAFIRAKLGDKVESMTPVIETFAMVEFHYRGQSYTRPIQLVGIDPQGKSETGEFAQHLLNDRHKQNPAACFTLSGEAAKWYNLQQYYRQPPADRGPAPASPPRPPGGPPPTDPVELPPELTRPVCIVMGYGIATYRDPQAKSTDPEKDRHILRPGDEVTITTVTRSRLPAYDGTAGPPRPVVASVVISDLYKSEMAEFDSNIVFIDLKDLQRLRVMQDHATAIQIKLKDYDRDKKLVVDTLASFFDPSFYVVQTWEDRQGPLLAAIDVERGILNLLLFLIIAVAGFGILAVFFMLVVEKTRDIGILKALGASSTGVMGIFLSYGLTLGLVGAGLGTAMGVTITVYINEIEQWLTRRTGQDVFPRDVYYFDQIPTDLAPSMVLIVNLGAVLIAVLASILPAIRAALLHPVRALRYD